MQLDPAHGPALSQLIFLKRWLADWRVDSLFVTAALAASGLPAGCLTIEVTETAVLDDEQSHATMIALRALGVKLALSSR